MANINLGIDADSIFGSGMMSLFTVAPKYLKFTNSNTDTSKKASIEILIGRDATP
jgi:hypothetical protein